MIRKAATGLILTGICLLTAGLSANTITFETPVGVTDGSNVPTRRGLLTGGGGTELDALGSSGPAHLGIGGPGAGNKYSNAKGSIAGNKPHNPFLAGNATFNLHINGLTESSSIKNFFSQFGNENGSAIVRIPPPKVSEIGATVALLSATLSGVVLLRRKLG
jgi:hypothetical protein